MSKATKTRRVTFSFDDRNLDSLKSLDTTPIKPCGHSGIIKHVCFPQPEPTGYKEVPITNPETGEKRILIVPTFD